MDCLLFSACRRYLPALDSGGQIVDDPGQRTGYGVIQPGKLFSTCTAMLDIGGDGFGFYVLGFKF
jgi:hypothetical protein